MNRPALVTVLLILAVSVLSAPAAADVAACGCYCGKVLRPPCSEDACKRACGWTGGSSGGSSSSSSAYDAAAAAAAAEAERQRELERQRQEEELRRQEEERRRREAEERKRRQEEFERGKQQALHDMKGIAGELGLKGLPTDDSLGLKGVGDTGSFGLKDGSNSATAAPSKPLECKWGDQDSSVVDLRCLGLDPDKPIRVDWHVARGQERVVPAQIDPETFQNANYNKGYEALMRTTFSVKDAEDAVAYFKAAKLQRPNDAMVRFGLLLAQDILKGRQQKEQDDKAHALELTRQAYAGLISGETGSARSFITRARELDPNNANLRFLDTVTAVVGPESTTASTPERRAAYKIVANSLVSISEENDAAAVAMLQAAQQLQPQDKFIGALLLTLRNYEAGHAQADSAAPRSATSPGARPQNELPKGPQQ